MTTQTLDLLNRLVAFKCVYVCVCVFKAGEFLQFYYQEKLGKRKGKEYWLYNPWYPPWLLDKDQNDLM